MAAAGRASRSRKNREQAKTAAQGGGYRWACPPPRPPPALGGARLASGMPALRAAITDLLASFTASLSAANAASCLRGGLSLGFSPSGRGGGFCLPGRGASTLPPLLLAAAAAAACCSRMCPCSWLAGTMLPQCGQGSSMLQWLSAGPAAGAQGCGGGRGGGRRRQAAAVSDRPADDVHSTPSCTRLVVGCGAPAFGLKAVHTARAPLAGATKTLAVALTSRRRCDRRLARTQLLWAAAAGGAAGALRLAAAGPFATAAACSCPLPLLPGLDVQLARHCYAPGPGRRLQLPQPPRLRLALP